MNKYQEAFESISDNQYQYGTDEQWALIEELVDKATPKKKEIRQSGELIQYYVCPTCYVMVYKFSKYCENCGQRIDGQE